MLAAVAAIHIALVPQHLREAPYAEAAVVALSVTALVLAAVLVIRESAAVWAPAAALSLCAIACYPTSRSVGAARCRTY